ncbi:MAG: membrane protein insertase YidC [Gemmatimonadota bacterium]|nr:membrane protein insertase YidC [Gemmatimonadota bacterium]
MAAVLLISNMLFPPPKTSPSAKATADSLARIVDSANRAVPATTAGVVAAPTNAGAASGSVEAAVPTIAIDTASIATKRAVYRTTNRGAALIGAEMLDYKALENKSRIKGDPVELARAGDRLVGFRLVGPKGDTTHLDGTAFRETRSNANGNSVVRYDATVGAYPVSIEYSFRPDSYRVNIATHVDGADGGYVLLDLPPGFQSSEADSVEDANHLAYALKQENKSPVGITFRSLDPGERSIKPGPITWVVAKNKYFLLGVLAPEGAPGFLELDVTGGVRATKQATRAQATIVAQNRKGNAAFDLYIGPQEFKRLAAVGRQFETSNPYGGFMQPMVQPFATMVIRVLLWMKTTLGLGYGWILVLFGISVRLLLWPLNQKAMRTSMAMQRIQPELQAIQTKYKSDPPKLQTEMMKLYKEHNMSPLSSLSGCLPMLIPLPVFFALFFVFQNTIEFRGVPFLWLPDISIRDPFFILPVAVAITAMALSWVGMKGMKANEQQKIMMYMMPAMMLLFFFNMASGLNLYYLVQNLASLPQQWLIAHERSKAAGLPLVRG